MLEHFFKDSTVVQRLRSNPLGQHLDSFAGCLAEGGYTRHTGKCKICVLADFGWWVEQNGIAVTKLDERIVDAFVQEWQSHDHRYKDYLSTVRCLLEHLWAEGVVPFPKSVYEQSSLSQIEHRYENYLKVERGLTQVTVDGYRPFIHRFLVHRFGEQSLCLHELEPSDISDFILRYAHTMSPGRAKLM